MSFIPFKTIYKKTKTGATQQWHREIDGSKYRTVSGQVGGKLVISDWKQCEGTNTGRANERTPEDQALFECAASRKKRLEKDYHESLRNIDEGAKIVSCMLAHEYKKAMLRKKPPILSDCYSQPKLDGMRCLTNRYGMWTRNGKPIVSCPHISDLLRDVFIVNPDLIFDGELYNHSLKADFNEIMSIVKKLKPTNDDLEKSASLAQYHVYDLITPDSKVFSERSKYLETLVNNLEFGGVHYVATTKINSEEHLDSLYEDYLTNGYEGQIIRTNSVYEGCRTWSLLKRKEFYDAEYILVDIEPGLGNWSGKAKSAILKLPDGRTFSAGITGTMEFCAELLKNKHSYIGKMTTVNYTNLTPAGVPRFGRCKEFHRMDT